MELLFVLAVVYVLYKLATSKKSGSGSSGGGNSSYQAPRQTPRSTPRPPSKDTYRPTSSRSSSGIFFQSPESSGTSSQKVTQDDLHDLCDAFTGEKLDLSKGLYRCEKCKVHYHNESFEVLRSENNGACVACGSKNLLCLTAGNAKTTTGRNFDPSIVSLADIRSHIGRVVTFEGYAHSVEVSRRGTDYAVMFEPKSWVKGFKLVFFKGTTHKVGGGNYIKGLKGRTIKVRGLVVNHPTFGLEIIVSERSMILSVQ